LCQILVYLSRPIVHIDPVNPVSRLRKLRKTMATRLQNLQRLLAPKTIAVVGGSVAAEMIRQCRKLGFAGQIWPVNAKRSEIEGLPCYPDVASLPGAPDATFIAVPREATIDIVASLAQRGAAGVVCYASGYAEVDAEGLALQHKLVQCAGEMALVGPNCYGMLNYLDGSALWPDRQGGKRVERGVALITQSGNIGLNITMQQRNLPIAYMIAVGNKAQADLHEYIDALLLDERVTAIGLHIEGLADVSAFSEVALRALKKGIPLVALKMGSSAIGAQLTASHTSTLAGSDVLYDALFKRLGVARVRDVSELIETLKLLHACGPLSGNDVTAMMCSGGDASMVADLGQIAGLNFPGITKASSDALHAVLGDMVSLNNPLDYQTYIWGDQAALTACFSGMMHTPADVSLLVLDYPRKDDVPIEGWDEVVNGYIAAQRQHGKPAIMVSTLPELMPSDVAEQLFAAGIAPIQGMREALIAVRGAAEIGMRRRQNVQPVARPAGAIRTDCIALDEPTAKAALAAHGLTVPASLLVKTVGEAQQTARAVGYPVVIKAVAPDLLHKTELGAVKLNLTNADQVAAAVNELSQHAQQFLVEKMVPGALAELIVGITRDAQFGLSLTVGAGGILVELMRDSVTLLLPTSRAEILSGIQGLKCFKLLDGYRGKPKADLNAIVSAIEAIVSYADAQRACLQELDVNPLLVLSDRAVAVDALIRIAVGVD
jgi:acetyl-CoA synthetase